MQLRRKCTHFIIINICTILAVFIVLTFSHFTITPISENSQKNIPLNSEKIVVKMLISRN